MDKKSRLTSIQRVKPANHLSNVNFSHKSIFNRATRLLDTCSKLKSVTTSKRSTAASRARERSLDFKVQLKEQTNPDTRTKMIQHFSIFGPYDPQAIDEDYLAVNIFPRFSPYLMEKTGFNFADTSTIEVIKMGKSIQLSKLANMKHSQLISSTLERGLIFEEDQTRDQIIPRANYSLEQVPREFMAEAEKWERQRVSLKKSLIELQGLVQTSTMGVKGKKTSLGKISFIEKVVEEHYQDIDRLKEQIKPIYEYDIRRR